MVNAVVENRFAEALKDARLCDQKLNSGVIVKAQLEIKMPLYGIPFTVKESCSLKGIFIKSTSTRLLLFLQFFIPRKRNKIEFLTRDHTMIQYCKSSVFVLTNTDV